MESRIETLCREKERELLDKYFGNLTKEAAIERPETTGKYTGKQINCKAFDDI